MYICMYIHTYIRIKYELLYVILWKYAQSFCMGNIIVYITSWRALPLLAGRVAEFLLSNTSLAHACVDGCMYVCMYVNVHIPMYTFMHNAYILFLIIHFMYIPPTHTHNSSLHSLTYICVHTDSFLRCKYVYINAYANIYMHMRYICMYNN